ncbi:MAG: hypothetical protein ABDH49_08325 [Candidatus Hydrothermales bacterium]
MKSRENGYLVYFLTWLSFVILTILTVTVSFVEFPIPSIVITIKIAGFKSTLVLLFLCTLNMKIEFSK